MKPICVTGFGIIDALGNNPLDCYNNYMSDKNFISDIDLTPNINKCFFINESDCILPEGYKSNNISKSSKFALHVVNQAMNMANVSDTKNVGVFFSGNVPLDHQQVFFSNLYGVNPKRLTPRKVLNSLPGSISTLITLAYQFKGINVGLNAACATGMTTIDYAMRCIDEYDYVVVGSTDDSASLLTAKLFDTLGALSNESKPFDKERSGFVLGEGAGCFILESEEKALARGAKIYARLYKVGISSDTASETSPDPDGKGAIESINKSISNAGLNIDFVNAHATSTVIGDDIEFNAISKVLNVPIYSCKGKIGHTLSASSIIESIYVILFGMNGHSGYNFNLTNPLSPSQNLITKPKAINNRNIVTLKNSFGFGGRCMSQVIEVINNE
jgi:3-oxoacyl-[acyl-carrier-protein] synthase II